MCGADAYGDDGFESEAGSSPRVRSRPDQETRERNHQRIISACAEQTAGCSRPAKPSKDHLRVCGADNTVQVIGRTGLGSSPRVRSRRADADQSARTNGIISACAERTPCISASSISWKDHLRVCGADRGALARVRHRLGSSPRVRSGRVHHGVPSTTVRIISACAERTSSTLLTRWTGRDHLRVCGADSCILLWFGLVGCRGIFDSCTARGRKTTWMPIFGIDALGSRMFLCEISEPLPCAEFWLRLHCVHVR